MAKITRGIIKSYSPALHSATVQIAGSIAVWPLTIPCATNIPAHEVLGGRECSVLFHTDDQPADAVVIDIHGVPPSPATFGDITVGNLTANDITCDDITGDAAGLNSIDLLPSAAITANAYLINASPSWTPGASSLAVNGLIGNALFGPTGSSGSGGTTGHTIRGLNFTVACMSLSASKTIAATELTGAYVRPTSLLASAAVNITNMSGVVVDPGFSGSANLTITEFRSFSALSAGSARASTFRHLYLAPLSAGGAQQPIYEGGSSAGDAHGNRFLSNTAFFNATAEFCGGAGVLYLRNRTTAPTSNPTNGLLLYSTATDLKIRGSANTVTLPGGSLPSISGSRADPEQALASLLAQLAAFGLIADNTTA